MTKSRRYDPTQRSLVTGGAGFLGSHLIDNLFTGTKRNIAHLLQHPRFEFIRPEITFAHETLGWEPSIQLREGLQKTIVYFEELLGGKSAVK